MVNGPPVVWWDPGALATEIDDQAALRHQRILEVDPDGIAAAASEQNFARWKSEREALLTRASQPSILVQTVTSLARMEAAKASDSQSEHTTRAHPHVHVEMTERGDAERPSGRRFGTLVHTLLASIDLDAAADTIEASAAVNGRMVGATDEEIQAAIVTVRIALGHTLLRRAGASARQGGLRRETPVLLRMDDGRLIEGVVDLAFREDTTDFAGWTVVDFKTDREFAASTATYIAQVRVYAQAVGAATGLPSRGIVFVI